MTCAAGLGDPSAFTEADILFHLGIAHGDGQLDDPRADGGHALRPARGLGTVLAPRQPDAMPTGRRPSSVTWRSIEAIAAGDAAIWPSNHRAHYAAADIASLKVAAKPPKGKARQ